MNNYTSPNFSGDSLASSKSVQNTYSATKNELLDFIQNLTKSFSQYVDNDTALKSELAEVENAASNCTKYNFAACASKLVKFLTSKKKIVQQYAAELLLQVLKFAVRELLNEKDPSFIKKMTGEFSDLASELLKTREHLYVRDQIVVNLINESIKCCTIATELKEKQSREDRLTSLTQMQDSFRNTNIEPINIVSNKDFDPNKSIDKFETNNYEIKTLTNPTQTQEPFNDADIELINIVSNKDCNQNKPIDKFETNSHEVNILKNPIQAQDSFENLNIEPINIVSNKDFDPNKSIDKFETNILEISISQTNVKALNINSFYGNGLQGVNPNYLSLSSLDIIDILSSFSMPKIDKDNCVETIEDLIPLLLHRSPTVRKEAAYIVATALDVGSTALASEKDLGKRVDLLIGMNRVVGKLTKLINKGLIKDDVKSIIADSLQNAKTTVDEVIKELEMMDLSPELIKKLQEGGIFLKRKRNEELVEQLILSEIDPRAAQQLKEIINKLTGGKTMKEVRGDLNQIFLNLIFGNQNSGVQNSGVIQSHNINLNGSMLRSELSPIPLGLM